MSSDKESTPQSKAVTSPPSPKRVAEIFRDERVAKTQHLKPRERNDNEIENTMHLASPSLVEMKTPRPLRVGVLGTARVAMKNMTAIANPVSTCVVTALASRDWKKGESFINEWKDNIVLHKVDDVALISGGDEGYKDLIESDNVDAVYIPLPTNMKKHWVIKALRQGKHVLVEHPVSLSSTDYIEMLEEAKITGKFLQDGTMFIHHHRMDEFLNHVTSEEKFGRIREINASFCILGDDEHMDKHIWPSKNNDPHGCIGVLGWYCVRMALLVFTGVGSGTVNSVQVPTYGVDDDGMPIDAHCIVKFDKDLVLNFHCSFIHATRQKLDVIGDKHTASMIDFVFPKHAITSFVVHDNAVKDSENHMIEVSDSFDSEAGPPQEVMMWRTFSTLAHGIDEANALKRLEIANSTDGAKSVLGWGESASSKEALALSSVSVETQMIVDELVESIRNKGKEIVLPHLSLV